MRGAVTDGSQRISLDQPDEEELRVYFTKEFQSGVESGQFNDLPEHGYVGESVSVILFGEV